MTAADYLDAVAAREQAATDGPWEGYNEREYLGEKIRPMWVVGKMHPDGEWGWDIADIGGDDQDRADAEFIAHARTDVPRLLAAVQAVLALCDGSIYADTILASLIRAAITDALEGR